MLLYLLHVTYVLLYLVSEVWGYCEYLLVVIHHKLHYTAAQVLPPASILAVQDAWCKCTQQLKNKDKFISCSTGIDLLSCIRPLTRKKAQLHMSYTIKY